MAQRKYLRRCLWGIALVVVTFVSWHLLQNWQAQIQLKQTIQRAQSTGLLVLTEDEIVQLGQLDSDWREKFARELTPSALHKLEVDEKTLFVFARAGILAAVNNLAKRLIAQRAYHKAEFWLDKPAQFDHASAALLAQVYQAQNRLNSAIHSYQHALQLIPSVQRQNPRYSDFYSQMLNFYTKIQVDEKNWLPLLEYPLNESGLKIKTLYAESYIRAIENPSPALPLDSFSCSKPVVLNAPTPQALMQLTKQFKQVVAADLFANFCLGERRWFNAQEPPVQANKQNKNLFMIHVGAYPRAYRQGPHIYISATSGTAVLQHEMAHWLGFEDEYELSERASQERCHIGSYEAIKRLGQNVILVNSRYRFKNKHVLLGQLKTHVPWYSFINRIDDWVQQDANGYYLKTNKNARGVGFYPAMTCHKVPSLRTFVPIPNKNFMFNHEFKIPLFYTHLTKSNKM